MSNNYSLLSTVKKYVSSSVLLIIATVCALICANVPFVKDVYQRLWELPVSFSIGDYNFFSHQGHALSFMSFINDFLMAFFFLSVGLEIKREFLIGELSSRKKAMLPIIGACGGMLVPVLLFWLVCPGDPEMLRGVAIPMATDIAFSLGVLSMFDKRVPMSLKIFLTALAVADDLGGIIVIALFYSEQVYWLFLILSLLVIAGLIIGNYFCVRSRTFYIVGGLILWFLMLNSGIHATISGVIVAFCVPASLKHGSSHYIERIRDNINQFPTFEISDQNKTVVLSNEQLNILKSIESASNHLISPLQDLEDNLRTPINYLIIPLFAFANAGVCFDGMHVADLLNGVGLAVVVGLLVGKFLGVLSFSWISIKLGIVNMPAGATWKAFASVCMLCGIGFTVSMFLADLSYSGTENGAVLLNNAKLGILIGTILSAIAGSILLHINLPKENS